MGLQMVREIAIWTDWRMLNKQLPGKPRERRMRMDRLVLLMEKRMVILKEKRLDRRRQKGKQMVRWMPKAKE